jgi:hypothetical protein
LEKCLQVLERVSSYSMIAHLALEANFNNKKGPSYWGWPFCVA